MSLFAPLHQNQSITQLKPSHDEPLGIAGVPHMPLKQTTSNKNYLKL
jgi:hypothetical protein